MSANVAEPTTDPTAFVDRAARVLTDFTDRLKELAQQLADKKTQPEAAQRFNALRPPAEELARHVSAEIEVGRADSLEKVELWLRLADFEYYLLSCTKQAGQSGGQAAAQSEAKDKPARRPWVLKAER